jgi:hypothetical protein
LYLIHAEAELSIVAELGGDDTFQRVHLRRPARGCDATGAQDELAGGLLTVEPADAVDGVRVGGVELDGGADDQLEALFGMEGIREPTGCSSP